MNGMDNMMSQLFQDKPIDQESLRSLSDGIMNQILASPVNFKEELLREERRKWGLVFLSVLLSVSIGLFLIVWFAKDWLQQVLSQVSLWVLTSVPGFGVFMKAGEGFAEKWVLLTQLKTGAEYLWHQYAFSIMGIALVWVLFEGVRDKTIQQ